MTTPEAMTKSDRSQLEKLVRRREKVAKGDVSARAAQLLHEFEDQMARKYHWAEEEVWSEAMAIAEAAVSDGNKRIAERCAELDIPPEFAPKLHLGWVSRGANAVRERQTELRRAARSKIDAAEKAAKAEIERQSVDIQTKLIAGGLESSEAHAFLDAMPMAEQLMQPLDVLAIESEVKGRTTGD